MPKNRLQLTAWLLAGAVLAAPALGAAPDAHGHDAHASAGLALTLNGGERWETDPPLRQAMSNIRGTLAEVAGEVHDGTLAPEDYGRLADSVAAQVDYIIANCDLPPDADAQLHILLEDLFEGIERMRAPAEAREGALVLAEALDAYGAHFEHEGWEPLGH